MWLVLAAQEAQVDILGFHGGVRKLFATRYIRNVDRATWTALLASTTPLQSVPLRQLFMSCLLPLYTTNRGRNMFIHCLRSVRHQKAMFILFVPFVIRYPATNLHLR